MKTCRIDVHPSVLADKPMRNILGMNNHPRIYVEARRPDQEKWFRELNLRHVRHHDAPLENPGFDLVDVSRIFPLFHLDENDPRNYCFEQTDDYFSVLAGLDVEIDFRLGETIDHSGFRRRVQPPPDPAKWARICKNIIAHYRDGKWNGMHLNISRATVWEEPDNIRLFEGTIGQYAELYCEVYKLFKQEWPDIQVGGPTMCEVGGFDFLEQFLRIIKREQVGLDYATVTKYTREMDVLPDLLARMRTMLDSYGYTRTGIVVTEWHMGGYTKWRGTRMDDGFSGSPSAAFAASTLIRLMDIDDLDVAYFYAWTTGKYAVLELRGDTYVRYPVYFGLKFFNELAVGCAQRVAVDCSACDDVEVLAGRTEDGKVRLLVSCYDSATTCFFCTVENAVSCTIRSIRSCYDEAEAVDGRVLERNEDGSFAFGQARGGSDVFLLEFSF